MNSPANARIRQLFDEAVELAPNLRTEFLDHACGDEPELRAAVHSLLVAHDRAAEFLADPTIPPARLLPAGLMSPGSHVGPYRLLRVVGEGGYGTVYEAEQDQPLRRTVALKVIKAGMDTGQVIARFELERQTLAMMDHPHIARVFDAGATEAGRPYFVMELVDGPPLTEYCRSHALDVRQRLQLFTLVCDAVRHAHQKGVIHRDLKPSNVLVMTRDDRPVPKVIDFGIAKVLRGTGAEDERLTRQAQFLGTPQYMSPEQFHSPPADPDTRSDVYSLGVLLYELLSDTAPFDPASLRWAAYEQIRRIIAETDPPLPSTRLLTLSQTSADNPGLHVMARRRAHQVRGDLDRVVMKAMEKDRSRRYGTAEALADDIGRYLSDEPVSAGALGRLYRAHKFLRRNRRLVAVTATIIVTLAAGMGTALVGLARAHRSQAAEARQGQLAEQRRIAAEANEQKAKDEAARLLGVQRAFYHLLIPQPDDAGATPREVLDFVASRAGDGTLADHPDAEAPVRAALGRGYMRLNLWGEAERQFRRGMALQQQLTGVDTPDTAAFLSLIGTCAMYQGRYDQAEPILRESLAVYFRHGFRVVAPSAVRQNLAAVLAARGDLPAAQSVLREALASVRNTPMEAKFDALEAINNLAVARANAGDAAAGAALRLAADTLRRRLAQDTQPSAAAPRGPPRGSGCFPWPSQ